MDKNNSTISINIPNPVVGIERLKNAILNASVNFYNGPVKQSISPSRNIFKSIKNPFKNFKLPRFTKLNKKLLLRLALPVLVVVVFLFGIISLVRNFNTTSADPNSISSEVGAALPKPIAVQTLNKTFNFPLTDDEGEEVGSFDYTIENAELRKQIIVQGKRATSIEGRIFLILNLKVVNNLDQAIQLNTRDYIRVIVNKNENEKLAPDIHNDPVEVQAISTKYTRLGLAINESDTKNPIILQVGEIGGEKQTVELNFK